MSCLRKVKLAIGTIRNVSSKILTGSCRNTVREAKHHHQLKQQCASVNSPSRVSWYSSTHSKFNSFHTFRGQTHQARPFFSGASRFFHSHHASAHQRELFRLVKKILIRLLACGGVVVLVCGGVVIISVSERIPYSKRSHVILLPTDFERDIGERKFNKEMINYEGKILAETHPECVRVRSIAKEIIEALQRGLRYEKVGSGLGYNNEVQDDKKVQESRIKSQAKKGSDSSEVATYHLEGLNWEIVVVDDPTVSAFCVPGGKIVVYTGLLDVFRTKAEIATILAHEVGHVVARHGAENVTRILWLVILKIVLKCFVDISDEITKSIFELYDFLNLPSSRRNEMEADYIGILLLASAGYDPRVAPQVYVKLGEVNGNSPLDDFLSTHPSGETRAKVLSRAEVMQEALSIYLESRSAILLEMFGMWVT